jgi:hypothetical protein
LDYEEKLTWYEHVCSDLWISAELIRESQQPGERGELAREEIIRRRDGLAFLGCHDRFSPRLPRRLNRCSAGIKAFSGSKNSYPRQGGHSKKHRIEAARA